MKTLLFAVSSKHQTFFNRIKAETTCDVDVVYTKKLTLPSLRGLRYVFKANLKAPIELRVQDYLARDSFRFPLFLIRLVYGVRAYATYISYFSLISDQYNQIMFWSGMTFRQAIALEVAKLYSIRPIYVENGFMPNRIVVDKKGVNYYNAVPRDREFFASYHNDKILPDTLLPRKPKNAKKFENIEKLPLPQKFIFVPFQLDYDTQIMLFSPWIKDMTILFETMENIAQNITIQFVFKEHPTSIKEYPKLHEKTRNSSNVMFANGYSTQELIEQSQAVITINSTVGIESLLLGKKVITLGEAFYNIDGIVMHATDQKQLEQILISLDDWNLDFALVENFLKYLYDDYLIEGSFEHSTPKQMEKIQKIIDNV
jgi:capsular polysaccharide export protein